MMDQPDISAAFFNVYVNGVLDVQQANLYSQLDIQPGDERTTYKLFDYGLVDRSDATSSNTNMRAGGRLVAPEAFSCSSMGILLSPSSKEEDRNAFIASHSAHLYIGRKIYQSAPLSLMFSVHSGAERLDSTQLLWTYKFNGTPLIIDNQQTFGVEIVAERGFHLNGPIRLWGILQGYHAKGVQ